MEQSVHEKVDLLLYLHTDQDYCIMYRNYRIRGYIPHKITTMASFFDVS